MNGKNTGGAAFPEMIVGPYGGSEISGGMTLLDWFAGQALASMRADGFNSGDWAGDMADQAYAIARAMLAEKRRREGGAA